MKTIFTIIPVVILIFVSGYQYGNQKAKQSLAPTIQQAYQQYETDVKDAFIRGQMNGRLYSIENGWICPMSEPIVIHLKPEDDIQEAWNRLEGKWGYIYAPEGKYTIRDRRLKEVK